MILKKMNTVSYLCYNLLYCACSYSVGSVLETERPELKDLCRYVLPLYAAHWKKIGIFLGIQPGQLEVIKLDNPADTNGCCMDLFIKWLEGTENVTWEKMLEAIDEATHSFSIGNVTASAIAATTTTTSK